MLIADLQREALEFLRPLEHQDLADWIEGEIVVPNGRSARPGPLRLNKIQREWCAAVDDPDVKEITIMKPTQIGFSLWLMSTALYFVDHDPSPMLVVYPTDSDARDVANGIFHELTEPHEGLAKKLEASRSKRSKTMTRRFTGGEITFTAAASPKNLRRHSSRVLLMDEISAMAITNEGDPIALALQRTGSWPNSIIILGSTPTNKGTCAAGKRYERSDKRVFEVRCPHCQEFFELLWSNIKWPKDNPAAAYALCENNGCVIEEQSKPGMVEAGRFRATAPFNGHRGFKVNQLVSDVPAARWGLLAQRFVREKDDPTLLQVFTNAVLGELWSAVQTEELPTDKLIERAEAFSLNDLPEQVLLLTAGVDVQKDRLECSVWGFDEQGGRWAIEHRVFLGHPSTPEPWAMLDEFLTRSFDHPLGGKIRIEKTAIDSGYLPDEVYKFVRGKMKRGLHAVKGVAGNNRASYSQPHKQKTKDGTLVGLVGTNVVKDLIFARIGLEPDSPQAVHFSDELPEQYFEQLTSEHRVTKTLAGGSYSTYERINSTVAAETLDCAVYAWAIATQVGTKPHHWEARRAKCAATAPRPGKPDQATQSGTERQKEIERRRSEAIRGAMNGRN